MIEKALFAHVGHALKTTRYTNGKSEVELFCQTCNTVICLIPEDTPVPTPGVNATPYIPENDYGHEYSIEIDYTRRLFPCFGFTDADARYRLHKAFLREGGLSDDEENFSLSMDLVYEDCEVWDGEEDVSKATNLFENLKNHLSALSDSGQGSSVLVDHGTGKKPTLFVSGDNIVCECGYTLSPKLFYAISSSVEIRLDEFDEDFHLLRTISKLDYPQILEIFPTFDVALDCLECSPTDFFKEV